MAAALSFAYTATPLAAGTKLAIWASGPKSAGRTFVPRSELRLLTVTAAAAASPTNILAAWNARWGALNAGEKIFFRAKTIASSGLSSIEFETSVVIT